LFHYCVSRISIIFSGLGQNTVLPCLAAVDLHSSLEQTPSKPWQCAFARNHHSSDLSLDRHVSTICSTRFSWLRKIRRIRRSLDTNSAAALVHALIAPRVDYCNTVMAGAPKTINGCLTRQPELSVEPGSSIAACPNCFTPSYIGWTFLNVSSINSESQFTGVCRIRLFSTWWTTARVHRTSQAANALDRLTVTSWCHTTPSQHVWSSAKSVVTGALMHRKSVSSIPVTSWSAVRITQLLRPLLWMSTWLIN